MHAVWADQGCHLLLAPLLSFLVNHAGLENKGLL